MMDAEQHARLVGRWKQGDSSAFEELYAEYVSAIYKFVYYRISHKQTAEDVTSDVFMKALGRIQQFDESKGTFQSWLYAIARNTLVDHYRTKKETVDIEQAYEVGENHDLDGHVDRARELEKVRAYLDTLPEDQREIVLLRVWDDLSYQQIAEIVGKSEAACKMMFSRSIGKLRKELPLAVLLMLFIT